MIRKIVTVGFSSFTVFFKFKNSNSNDYETYVNELIKQETFKEMVSQTIYDPKVRIQSISHSFSTSSQHTHKNRYEDEIEIGGRTSTQTARQNTSILQSDHELFASYG